MPKHRIVYSPDFTLIDRKVGIGTTNPTQKLDVNGNIRLRGALYDNSNGIGNTTQVLTSTGAGISWADSPKPKNILTSNQIDLYYVTLTNANSGVSTADFINNEIVIKNGNVGIGTTNPQYNLHVIGDFGATTKSFLIPHPTKPGMNLRYGSLESPYHGIRLTGSSTVKNGVCVVTLPDYIHSLVKEDDLNINITNIKHGKVIWVEEVNVKENKFTVMMEESVGEYNFYWDFTAIRKDVEDMIVEF